MSEKNRTNEKPPAIAIRCDAELKSRYQLAIKQVRGEVLSDRGQPLGDGRSLIYAMRRIVAMTPAERAEFMRAGRELEREELRAREKAAGPSVGAPHAQLPALGDGPGKADDHAPEVKPVGRPVKRRK